MARPLLRDNDEYLGPRKRRQAVFQGYIVVPRGHDGDARRAAADGDLAVPTDEVPADPCEPLAPATVAAPAPNLHDGHLARRPLAPTPAAALPHRPVDRDAHFP